MAGTALTRTKAFLQYRQLFCGFRGNTQKNELGVHLDSKPLLPKTFCRRFKTVQILRSRQRIHDSASRAWLLGNRSRTSSIFSDQHCSPIPHPPQHRLSQRFLASSGKSRSMMNVVNYDKTESTPNFK